MSLVYSGLVTVTLGLPPALGQSADSTQGSNTTDAEKIKNLQKEGTAAAETNAQNLMHMLRTAIDIQMHGANQEICLNLSTARKNFQAGQNRSRDLDQTLYQLGAISKEAHEIRQRYSQETETTRNRIIINPAWVACQNILKDPTID